MGSDRSAIVGRILTAAQLTMDRTGSDHRARMAALEVAAGLLPYEDRSKVVAWAMRKIEK